MKNIKKIGLGLGLVAAFFLCAVFLGFLRAGQSSAIGVPGNINPIASYLKDGNYHFWINPDKPSLINAQIPKDNDPTKNLYFFKHNSTDKKNNLWIYTVAGTSNPNLFCSGTSITAANISNTNNPVSNLAADFKYVYPGSLTKCNPPLGHDEINPLNIDVTSNTSGVPGSGVKGAPCTSGADCVNGVCQKDGGLCFNTPSTTQSSSSCEALDGSFQWLLCPILEMFDSIANSFNKVLNNLLSFNVSSNLTSGVKGTWSIMKNIASALLVIIMLVAIFAQAIGGGPIDAYTVRKIIPRLVAAVILMQLSWVILEWIIEVSNALGEGVRGLISAPFGGWQNLNLDHLIKPLGGTGTLTSAALFTGLAGTIAFSGLTLGGIFLLACAAILGILIAFSILILRNMLIVLLVMLAPIAILLWILPGTERYWKMWWSNFIKLLMLFPLIMALVYAGRVFAHVAANNGASTGVGAAIIATFVVFVGYFGPYFFLPQAFKWGGQMFGAIAGGAWSATKGLRNAPAKFAQNQAKTNRQQRETDRFERLSYNRGRFGDKILAAAGGFGLSKSATGIREARNRAEGREAGEKSVAQEVLGSEYEEQDHQRKLDTLTTLAQGKKDEATGLDGKNPAMQRWALDQLATFGDWDRIDAMRANDQIDERTWQSFVAKNISAIHQNAPHLSPIRRDMSGLGYQEYASWKDHSFHELERQVTHGVVRTADAKGYEASSDPARQRSEAIKKAQDALKDDRVRANLSTEAVQVLTRISKMDDNKEVQVTTDRRGRVAGVQLPSGHMLGTDGQARANLDSALMPTPTGDPRTDQSLQARSQAAIETISTRLANPKLAPNDPERQGLEAYLAAMRSQAVSSRNEYQIQTYNTIINQTQQKLAAYPQQAEADARLRGVQGEQLAAERQQAQVEVDAERVRTQGEQGSLKPIPPSSP